MKVRFRNKLESFVRCEEQLWPDCGGPSNTFLPPHAVQPRRPRRQSHPNLFLLGFRPKLRQQSTSKNLFSFMTFVGSESQNNWGVGRRFQGGCQRPGLRGRAKRARPGGVRGVGGVWARGPPRLGPWEYPPLKGQPRPVTL